MKAGVPDTYKLAEGFREDIKSDAEVSRVVTRNFETLQAWKLEEDTSDTRVDVELLLEALDKMESRRANSSYASTRIRNTCSLVILRRGKSFRNFAATSSAGQLSIVMPSHTWTHS